MEPRQGKGDVVGSGSDIVGGSGVVDVVDSDRLTYDDWKLIHIRPLLIRLYQLNNETAEGTRYDCYG